MTEYSNAFIETFRCKMPLPDKPWFDCDTTPHIHSRRAKYKTPERYKAEALALLDTVDEGQIGIYASCFGPPFYGYAIKYKGQAAYFEEPKADH